MWISLYYLYEYCKSSKSTTFDFLKDVVGWNQSGNLDGCHTNSYDFARRFRLDYFRYVSNAIIVYFHLEKSVRFHRCWWNYKSDGNRIQWTSISILGVRQLLPISTPEKILYLSVSASIQTFVIPSGVF